MLSHLFADRKLECEAAGDFDDNDAITVADALQSMRYIFSLGPAPAPPFPDPALDPTQGALRCQ
jgi:hypothetical protein